MRKHNQIHTLSAPHYKAYFQFLRKLKEFKCVLWSEKNTVFNIHFFHVWLAHVVYILEVI